MNRYFDQLWTAFDQFWNAVWGGWADETFSSRCWRCRDRQPFTFLRKAVDFIMFLQKDHCQKAYEDEKARHDSPPEFRK